ncbi:hypothetical protein GP486_005449 [Trichoglossum hirsutum]|uniref:JmjC domain-containing protein n=1 Tax=Trichoglossum hirsutum TaxID=265104 RepID=A0A9P8RM75_9PEZI|nr:hypothetical protein GP486_005449 [Trichoglossum hirsutum]
MTTTTLPSQDHIYRFLPGFKILLCIPCGSAVQPHAITSHLYNKEHHDLSCEQRQALRSYALTYDLTNHEHIPLPEPNAMPVPGLRLMSGFSCGLCTYLTASWDCLTDHGRRQHGRRKRDGVYWREVKLQTFFRGRKLRYFIVKDPDIVPDGSPVPPNPSVGRATPDIKEQPGVAGPTSAPDISVAEAVDEPAGIPEPYMSGNNGFGVDSVNNPEISPNYPFMCTRDPDSDVLTFRPSLEEFHDFPKFLTEALAASRAGPSSHVGLCVVKVPQGGLDSSGPAGIARSRNSRCVQYFEQTAEAMDSTDGGVFRINHATKGPTTILQWQKQVDAVTKVHGNAINDDRMMELLRQERLKAVYLKLEVAKSISSLLAVDPIGLSHLPGNQLHDLDIPGMSSDYIYLGAPGSLFTMHLEDYNVHSFNYLRSGKPKRWVVVNPGSRAKFEDLIKATFPKYPASCSQFMRHQNFYMSPSFLRKHSIGFVQVTQTPGDMMVLYPFAYHQGYNMGDNLAIASNFALESEEPLYERGYVPCEQECCPGLAPLVLNFPLKREQQVKDVATPKIKKVKVCAGRDGGGGSATPKLGRGRPKKNKT